MVQGNKSRLGVNTILTISQLLAKAGALSANLSLYKYINQLYKSVYKEEIPVEKIPTPCLIQLTEERMLIIRSTFRNFK